MAQEDNSEAVAALPKGVHVEVVEPKSVSFPDLLAHYRETSIGEGRRYYSAQEQLGLLVAVLGRFGMSRGLADIAQVKTCGLDCDTALVAAMVLGVEDNQRESFMHAAKEHYELIHTDHWERQAAWNKKDPIGATAVYEAIKEERRGVLEQTYGKLPKSPYWQKFGPAIAKAKAAYGELKPYSAEKADEVATELFFDLVDASGIGVGMLPSQQADAIATAAKGDISGKTVIQWIRYHRPTETLTPGKIKMNIDTVVHGADALTHSMMPNDPEFAAEAANLLSGIPFGQKKSGPELVAFAAKAGAGMDDVLRIARRQERKTLRNFKVETNILSRLAKGGIGLPCQKVIDEVARKLDCTTDAEIEAFSLLARGYTGNYQQALRQLFHSDNAMAAKSTPISMEATGPARTEEMKRLVNLLLRREGLSEKRGLPDLAGRIALHAGHPQQGDQAQSIWKKLQYVRGNSRLDAKIADKEVAKMIASFAFPETRDEDCHGQCVKFLMGQKERGQGAHVGNIAPHGLASTREL